MHPSPPRLPRQIKNGKNLDCLCGVLEKHQEHIVLPIIHDEAWGFPLQLFHGEVPVVHCHYSSKSSLHNVVQSVGMYVLHNDPSLTQCQRKPEKSHVMSWHCLIVWVKTPMLMYFKVTSQTHCFLLWHHANIFRNQPRY